MFYYIARQKYLGPAWVTFKEVKTTNGQVADYLETHGSFGIYKYDGTFGVAENAIKTIKKIREVCPGIVEMGLVNDEGNLVWMESEGWVSPTNAAEGLVATPSQNPQEEQVATSDIEAPLHIPREALIAALQVNLDAEKAKREEATAKRAEARARSLAALKTFSDDELLNIVSTNVFDAANPLEFEQWVQQKKESKTYVSVEKQPNVTESTLERTVRVLGLASDKEIEVKPSDPIYPLL